MKQVLAVYEGDQGYARGLTGYLTVRHRVPFQVVTLTKEEMVVHMAASGKIRRIAAIRSRYHSRVYLRFMSLRM